jgi:hypothetical protein
MGKKVSSVFLWLVATSFGYAQRDTLYLDSLSANFVVQYWGTFAYAADSAGLHRLDGDGRMTDGQTYVEKDPFVTVIFEPATKIRPRVFCSISMDTGTTPYVYMYRIENGIGSQQTLGTFEVAYGSGVKVVDRTPKNGWHSGPMYRSGGSGLILRNRWMWFGDTGLEPGREWTVGGLACDGLPGIMPASFTGRAKTVGFPGAPSYEFQKKIAAIHMFDSNCVKGWTLGPMPVPKPFNHLAFLDSLISCRQRCVELGWITKQPGNAEFDTVLRDARKHLGNFDKVAATLKLREFLYQLEENKETSMANDAYMLLKFNAAYLIDRLAETK